MKVEEKVGKLDGAGEQPANKSINKKKWIILFSIIGVVIVGLVIAIIVVLVNRGNGGTQTNQTTENVTGEISDEEADAIHDEEINKLMSGFVLEEGVSIEDMVAAIKEKMDATTDKKLKARYAIDYYTYLPILDQDLENMDKIIKAMIEADNIVKNTNSE